MTYIALIDIDDYKKGEVVPDEKAIIWSQMFAVSPVKLVESHSEPIVSESKVEVPVVSPASTSKPASKKKK